jgi:hypothetical protein
VEDLIVWNLEGLRVEAGYLDGTVPVRGVVHLSRVKYGGGVSHHLTLDEGFTSVGGRVHRDAGEGIIVDHQYVTRVMEAS